MSEIAPFKVLYDYADVPTVRRFAASDKRVRCILGCFGSGKSSGCVIEIFRRAQEQRPGPDGIRRSRWAVVRNCYDDQTEVLTEGRGWQLFKDVLPEDKIASNIEGKLEYLPHNGVAIFPYQGEMLGFQSESVDFLVTPEHMMWVSQRRTRKKVWGEYEVALAEDIYGKQTVRVKKDIQWEGVPQKYSVDFFEFLGFWFADGSCGEYPRKNADGVNRRLNLTQAKHLEYVEDLLNRNNFEYHKCPRTDNLDCFLYDIYRNAVLQEIFVSTFLFAGVQSSRRVPQWIKSALPEYLKAFLYGYFMGDGSKDGGTIRLCTCSEALANDLQEIALKSGQAANITVVDSIGRETILNDRKCITQQLSYKVTILGEKKLQPVLHVNPKQTNKLKGWYKREYDGNVYCLEMPLVPVYVRRNKKALWCMRTYNQLKDTTIRTVHDWFPPKLFGEYRITDHIYVVNQIPGVQLEILFRALDRPDQVANLLSLELTGAWFNEAREIPKTIVDAMDGRIGRYPSVRDGGGGWHGMILDSNPPDTDSWIYKTFEQNCPDTWEIFKQPSGLSVHAENLKHLPKNYYQNLAKGKDEMYVRVYVHGQYGYMITGKPVFASFKDNIHVALRVLEPIKGLTVFIGLDFALQPSATLAQLTPTGQLLILDELVSDGMGIRRFSETQLLPLLRRKYFGCNVVGFGDPSGVARAPTDESSCFDVLHSPEIGLSEIYPATTNALIPRIGAVEHFLNHMSFGEPSFVLSPNCKNLRKALNGAYHYEKDPKGKSGDEYKPIPAKNFASHISDSLQMLCLYVLENGTEDKARKAFFAQMKNKQHRPASSTVGY